MNTDAPFGARGPSSSRSHEEPVDAAGPKDEEGADETWPADETWRGGPRNPHEVRSLSSITTYHEAARVFFTRRGPRTLAACAGLAWLSRAALGPPGLSEPIVVAAVGAWWPLQEWLMHKHLLHRRPTQTRLGTFDPLFARTHRWHHEHPDDVDGTLLPPSVIFVSMPIAAGILLALLGPRRRTVTAFAAYSTAALIYEWTHFIVHTGVRPKHPYVKGLRRNHLLHHYRNEKYWHGFTAPLVDRVFGTDPDPASVPRSKTAMDLYGLRAAEENASDAVGSRSGRVSSAGD